MNQTNLTDQEKAQALYKATVLDALHSRINNYHRRTLHEGQLILAKAYFKEKKKVIQAQYGRSTGKSEGILYIAWRRALTEPGSIIYIVCPERAQGKEIYWASNRLQTYGPPEYIETASDSDLRLSFKNGSFICVTGCKNLDALRGIKPNLVFYDEFQQHTKEFDQEVMRPNLGVKGAALIICGTPPKRDCYYVEFKKRLLRSIQEGDKTRAYFQLPSSVNPNWDKDELNRIKKDLIAAGDEAIWRREYLGEDCLGGAEMVFPFWNIERYGKDKDYLKKLLSPDASKLKWITACDPGTSTVFATIFACYNPFTSQFFVLDEIYQRDRKKMDTGSVWKQIQEKEKFWNPKGKWLRIADEAAAWFRREMSSQFQTSFAPTRKSKNNKDDQVSLLKMMMVEDSTMVVSKECVNLDYEMKNYVTDDKGDFIDGNDDLLDALRYALSFSGFKFAQKVDQEQDLHNSNSRAKNSMDWTEIAVLNSYN